MLLCVFIICLLPSGFQTPWGSLHPLPSEESHNGGLVNICRMNQWMKTCYVPRQRDTNTCFPHLRSSPHDRNWFSSLKWQSFSLDSSQTVVVVQRRFCPPRDICQNLELFGLQLGDCYWHPVSQIKGRCYTAWEVQDSPHNRSLSGLNCQ